MFHRNIDSRRVGLLREQYAEKKKGRLLYYCNLSWMKIGGQILWTAKPICETSQISYLIGRRPMKDVSENHLKTAELLPELLLLLYKIKIPVPSVVCSSIRSANLTFFRAGSATESRSPAWLLMVQFQQCVDARSALSD